MSVISLSFPLMLLSAADNSVFGGPPWRASPPEPKTKLCFDFQEIDPKAGGGNPMTIGTMLRNMLQSLDWYSTLFPRIPVPIQKQINAVIANK